MVLSAVKILVFYYFHSVRHVGRVVLEQSRYANNNIDITSLNGRHVPAHSYGGKLLWLLCNGDPGTTHVQYCV